MLALIIIVCLTAISSLGSATSDQFQAITDRLNDVGGDKAPAPDPT